jgi:hypothetical protein
MTETESVILLTLRPYAKASGRLKLVPLLPERKPMIPLPAELWAQIFESALELEDDGKPERTDKLKARSKRIKMGMNILLTSKSFKVSFKSDR